jgi:hypothetical protein
VVLAIWNLDVTLITLGVFSLHYSTRSNLVTHTTSNKSPGHRLDLSHGNKESVPFCVVLCWLHFQVVSQVPLTFQAPKIFKSSLPDQTRESDNARPILAVRASPLTAAVPAAFFSFFLEPHRPMARARASPTERTICCCCSWFNWKRPETTQHHKKRRLARRRVA